MRKTAYPGTQSVRRALGLLRMFSEEHPDWGLSELARAVDLNKTTVYRLVTALEAEGLLARSPETDAYRIGPGAIKLGALAMRTNDLRSAARAELEALARETGETATLEVLIEGQVLIQDAVEGLHLLAASPAIGTRWPAHATATGKVLLAALAEEGRAEGRPRRVALGRLSKLTPLTIVTRADLERELARVRERGYATAVEELERGFAAVAAPVRNHADRVVAAISLGGPRTRLTDDGIPGLARLLRRAASRISRRLGGPAPRIAGRPHSEETLATHSSSTRAPSTSPLTPRAVRAGRWRGKKVR